MRKVTPGITNRVVGKEARNKLPNSNPEQVATVGNQNVIPLRYWGAHMELSESKGASSSLTDPCLSAGSS